MELVSCNLCGSRNEAVVYRQPDAQFFRDEWFSIVKCTDCGLGYVNPRPDPEEIGKYYPAAFFTYFEQDATFHRERYAREAEFLGPASRDSPLLLDIGCANGGFPRYMRELGWNVEGVEVSAAASEITDFRVFRQEFSEIPLPADTYDAITAWAVLEHVHDPMAYFQRAADVLRGGGVFAFLVTNFESLGSRRLFLEDVPRHLYFFTEECVRRYLGAVGLSLVRVDYSDRIYGMDPRNWLVYYLRRARGRPFTWHDAQNAPERYFLEQNVATSTASKVRFALRHPVIGLDRLSTPLYARWQTARRRYGITTYLARKP